jgi:uncharacterized OB-fold protein
MTTGTEQALDADAAIQQAASEIIALGESSPRPARDPINLPMINNWAEALGDSNPVYTSPEQARASVHGGPVAPPAMIQAWTMPGLNPPSRGDDPLYAMMGVLDKAGFASVVATNCDQTYHRYLRHGEHLVVTTRLESVVGPKRTGLGEGWFVTTRNTWYVGTEAVAEMLFRVLKFRPPEAEAPQRQEEQLPAEGEIARPVWNRDTEYFWEGTAAGELRIQRCGGCGLLRHPPGPMCPECGATKPTYLVSDGRGEVYSYVVHHRPPVPGRTAPFVVALVELDEGVRMLGELTGIDPDKVDIGLRVQVGFQDIGEGATLPYWRPSEEGIS